MLLPVLIMLLGINLNGCAALSPSKLVDNQIPDFSHLYQNTRSQVVFVKVRYKKPENDEIRPTGGSGSGVVLSSSKIGDGKFESLILTNHHVVEHAERITVFLSLREQYDASLLGFSDRIDLAVVKIVTPSKLTPVILGNSELLKIGEPVYVIGNPLGLKWSLSVGYISNLWHDQPINHIQVDGAVTFGNSGGGFFNRQGELIGITTATREGVFGLAISSNVVKALLPRLSQGGRVPHAFLGIYTYDIENLDGDDRAKEIVAALGISPPFARDHGVIITAIISDMPAAKAGLEKGDIILEINGGAVLHTAHLQKITALSTPGSAMHIKVLRNGQEKVITVIPTERPPKGD